MFNTGREKVIPLIQFVKKILFSVFFCNQNGKYGYRKYNRKCHQIHLTDGCERNKNCQQFLCDQRHPVRCKYFEKFGRCTFESFCSNDHRKSFEENLKTKVVSNIELLNNKKKS